MFGCGILIKAWAAGFAVPLRSDTASSSPLTPWSSPSAHVLEAHFLTESILPWELACRQPLNKLTPETAPFLYKLQPSLSSFCFPCFLCATYKSPPSLQGLQGLSGASRGSHAHRQSVSGSVTLTPIVGIHREDASGGDKINPVTLAELGCLCI